MKLVSSGIKRRVGSNPRYKGSLSGISVVRLNNFHKGMRISAIRPVGISVASGSVVVPYNQPFARFI